eukprot:scaffold1733_cov450-Pavlova_lutheri.AAC.3
MAVVLFPERNQLGSPSRDPLPTSRVGRSAPQQNQVSKGARSKGSWERRVELANAKVGMEWWLNQPIRPL